LFLAAPKEQSAYAPASSAFITNRLRSLDKLLAGQQLEKVNSVKDVRFPDAIGSRDAGEWTKMDLGIEKVLKAGDFELGKHLEALLWLIQPFGEAMAPSA
jgi:hypothetical protein